MIAHARRSATFAAALLALVAHARAQVPVATPMSGVQALAGPSCGPSSVTTSFSGTTGPILPTPSSSISFQATVSGLGTYLWDVELQTSTFAHPRCSDLDITLTSPAGTVVVISTDNGGTNNSVFNGTLWNDQVSGTNVTVNDYAFTNFVGAPQLNPEGRLEALRGEDPNGVWTLTIADDAAGSVGSLQTWALNLSTIAAPVESTTTFSSTPGTVFSDFATVNDTLAVSGQPAFLSSVTLYTEIRHTWTADMRITLISPAGTIVKIATDMFGDFDDTFDGTLFTGDAPLPITDIAPTHGIAIPVCGPEGALAAFRGENPNGVWTLQIENAPNGDVGVLDRWDLAITTMPAPVVAGPTPITTTYASNIAIPDGGGGGPVTPTSFTAAVVGVDPVLWDVDLVTFLRHTTNRDLDITLTSPVGTTVTITTDNGGVHDDVFYGTRWDGSAAETAQDHVYANLVTATPLCAEGSLAAFRGEDPNGIWTLTVTDDTTASGFGSLDAWSLDLTTLAQPLNEFATTVSRTPNLVIPGASTGSDLLTVGGASAPITGLSLYVELLDSITLDLALTLTSPSGTALNVVSFVNGAPANAFNGTLFDPDSTDVVTDHDFASPALQVSSERSFDAVFGEDPNGVWTLAVQDVSAGGGATLVRWDLNVRTCVGAGQAFCTNGSLGVDHTTACPCGNTGLAGHGCGHSFDANGAQLDATGSAAADTVVLHSRFTPAASFTLFLQHDAPGDTVFHDGVLCAGNPLVRLRGRAAVAGEAFFPNTNFANDATTTLSQRGGTFVGSGATKRYSAWYRNASSTFCPPATANVTNGWVVVW